MELSFLKLSCFFDYTKAFDCVDHKKLWKILQVMGIPDYLTCLLRNLYTGQDGDADSESNDTDSDIEDPEEPDDGIYEETEPINGYKRCYDKIPAGAYEGFFADKKIEPLIKKILGYDGDYELKEEDLEKITEIGVSAKDLRGFEKLVNLEYVKFQDTEGNIYDFTPLSNLKKLKKIRIYFRPPADLDPSVYFLQFKSEFGDMEFMI